MADGTANLRPVEFSAEQPQNYDRQQTKCRKFKGFSFVGFQYSSQARFRTTRYWAKWEGYNIFNLASKNAVREVVLTALQYDPAGTFAFQASYVALQAG